MSAPVMQYTVVVLHPETNAPVALLAGQPVPKWASDLVQPDDLIDPVDIEDVIDVVESVESVGDEEPPRSGKGSGVDAWSQYAAGRGITVPEGASREDVIALVDASK